MVTFCLTFILVSIDSVAQSESVKEEFLDRLKSSQMFDDASFSDRALVLWPSPNLQHVLDIERVGETLCAEYLKMGFLVIWFMDSAEYRNSKAIEMLGSQNCLQI
jgi:hypothetical protein